MYETNQANVRYSFMPTSFDKTRVCEEDFVLDLPDKLTSTVKSMFVKKVRLVHVVDWVDSKANSESKDNIDEALWLWIDDKQDTAGLIAIRTENIINWLITNHLIGDIATVNCLLDNINIADDSWLSALFLLVTVCYENVN